MPPDPATTNRIPVACLAPPLTDEKLARYEKIIQGLGVGELKDELGKLLLCVKAWWKLPDSKRTDVTRWNFSVPTGKKGEKGEPVRKDVLLEEVPLEEEHKERLYEVTPWMRELETLSNGQDTGLFDKIPPGDLRNCAHHLLWFCKELTLDREPLTQDKLPKS